MIIPLLQPTNHTHRNRRIAVLYENRHATTVNRILARLLPQPHLLSKQLLISTVELVMQLPRAAPKPNNRITFPGHPEIIVERGAGVRYLFVHVNEHPFLPLPQFYFHTELLDGYYVQNGTAHAPACSQC